MDKVEAYPWIGVVIGVLIGILPSMILSPSDSYIVLNTIVFGTIVGCTYGYALSFEEESSISIIIGGIVGCLFGLHLISLCIFVFGGAYIIPAFMIGNRDKNDFCFVMYLLLCPTIGAIMGLLSFFYSPFDISDNLASMIIAFAILGLIPLVNMLMALFWGGFIGWGIMESIESAPPLFSIPLIAVVGYGIGKIVNEIAIERENKSEDTKHRITQVKRKIEETKMLGLDDPNAENIIKNASEHFRMRKYGIAKDLAEKAEKPAEEYLQKHDDATAAIQKASGVIDNGKRFGCNVRNAEDLLNKAISTIGSALERGSQDGLKEAERLANEAQKVAKRIMMKSKPKISITLYPEEEFRPHSWQNVKLEVSNVGAAHAMDVMMQFSKEVEVKDLGNIGKILSKGERKVLKFMLKPLDMGEVPVDITVNFRDLDGTSYEEDKRFNLTVSQEVPEVKVTMRDWEFMKDVIEEVTQNRVEVKELRQDLGRRYSDKDLARILEASKIMEEMVEMSYQEAIRTDDFFDKLRLLEGYTEGLSKKVRSEINEFRRFLKEELFEYVDAEHKRDVRRFCRNLLDIWIADVLSRER